MKEIGNAEKNLILNAIAFGNLSVLHPKTSCTSERSFSTRRSLNLAEIYNDNPTF